VNYNKELLKGKDKSFLSSLKLKTKSVLAQTAMKLYK